MPERVKTIEKEIPEKDTRLSFDVSTFSTEDEATLVLTASRIGGGMPITGAKAVFFIERMQQPGTKHAEHNISTVVEREAEEIAGKGMYRLRYRFGEHGLYRITGRVWTDGRDASPTPLVIAVTEEVNQREGHEAGKSATSMVMIGGIGMVLMMLIMIL
jgi:hypothetical protein